MAVELFTGFQKRDGLIVPFDSSKIQKAISQAAIATIGKDNISEKILPIVIQKLDNKMNGNRVPSLEIVQDTVQLSLKEAGYIAVSERFEQYRKLRQKARERITVHKSKATKKQSVTDKSLLLVESRSFFSDVWNRSKLVKTLQEQTKLDLETCISISKKVENKIIEANWTTVSTAVIRELTNQVLSESGYTDQIRDQSVYYIPRVFVDDLMDTKSDENSNIVNNNPEAVNLGIAELVLKQWGLDVIFSDDVRLAHDTGAIHLHDLGFPTRVYCSSHSLEYLKKYGLRQLSNLSTESFPSKSASVLTGHLNTYLASMQAFYAGALGIGYINIFYAPYLVGLSDKEYKQRAQEIVFNGSQNAFSRGGQTLFLDFNVHPGVPYHLRKVPAIGPGGKYMLQDEKGNIRKLQEIKSKVTDPRNRPLMILKDPETKQIVLEEDYKHGTGIFYKPEIEKQTEDKGWKVLRYEDYEQEAQKFAVALLETWKEGDANGNIFPFPKCDFHVDEECLNNPEKYKIFLKACELASHNGSTYFVFDRDAVTLSACCRLRTTIEDHYMLSHPESLRFCGFQNITLNIPQAAYKAVRLTGKSGQESWNAFLDQIDQVMQLAMKAHIQKKEKIETMMSAPGKPLWQIGKPACDGQPYVNLKDATYIIGLLGINDALKYLFGQEMHESDEVMTKALELVGHMFFKCQNFSKRHGIKVALEESPAESATRRLARTDLNLYPEAKKVVKGSTEEGAYYTNSCHLAPECNATLVERIRKQSMFHSMIESGAIVHAFVGEQAPDPKVIAKLVEDVYHLTQCAQLCFSPEFTLCNKCNNWMRGNRTECDKCNSTDVDLITRVVGYFSRRSNWNTSKKEELKARREGDYKV